MPRILQLTILLTGLLSVSAHADPILINFDPVAQTTEFGNQVSVDVTADAGGQVDLFGPVVIAAYDLIVNWDSTLLSLADVMFGGSLGDPELVESLQGTVPGTGMVNVAEVSFLFDFTGLQDGSVFTLFTLVFDTLDVGTSSLDISDPIVGDFAGLPLEAVLGTGSIEITERTVAVAEPGTLLLFMTGLLAIRSVRRRSCQVICG